MPIWPFKKRPSEDLTPEEMRATLIAAASGSKRKLRKLCEQYKQQVAENLDVMSKPPEGMPTDQATIDRYVQALGTVANCLAMECHAPELWQKLCGTAEDNPLLQWDRWYGELPERMQNLEHETLISEARSFIERAQDLRGHAARQNEAFLQGRLGEILFHSGRASEAIEPFQAALGLCQDIQDVEGQVAYLRNLLEVHRYLGNSAAAVSIGEELIQVCDDMGQDARHFQEQVQRIREGEPLCRIVCVRDEEEWELDQIPALSEGRYEFQFRRNRMSLQKAIVLVQQGNRLASDGQLADALEKYQEASEVDPYDPDPWYQRGMCLLELGAYAQAKEAFEEVERLAPGWFRCRSDFWLAKSLEEGSVSDEEFRLLRVLEDGGLAPEEGIQIAQKAVESYPEFAPFYLSLGDYQHRQKQTENAIASYRTGLELVEEPDLESRLLCALAGVLPSDSPERKTLIEKAVRLKGSLVAQASAKLMGITNPDSC